MAVRWKDKGKLVALAGTERIPATSMAGGAKEGGGAIAAGEDIHVTPDDLRGFATKVKIVTEIVSGVITPTGDTDELRPPALTAALTIANPSSVMRDGDGFTIELIDNGTSRALTWGSKYANRMGTLPVATTVGKLHYLGVKYVAADDKLYCMYAQVQS